MSRTMKNEKLINTLRLYAEENPEAKLLNDTADALEAAEHRIAELEAQIPKEGEWIFSRGDGKTCVDGWTCSACGNSFHTNVPYFEEFHYCPNCGAKMDGEEQNDEE